VIYRLRICPGHHSSLQLGVTKFRVNRLAAVSTAIHGKTPVSGALSRLIYFSQNRLCCGEIGGAATVYELSVYNTPHLGCHLRFLIVIKHVRDFLFSRNTERLLPNLFSDVEYTCCNPFSARQRRISYRLSLRPIGYCCFTTICRIIDKLGYSL